MSVCTVFDKVMIFPHIVTKEEKSAGEADC